MRTFTINGKKLRIGNYYIWSGKYITSIKVTTRPTKISYWVGDSIDLTGLVVNAVYSDGTASVIPNSELTIVPTTANEFTDDLVVKVYYKNFSTQFSVVTFNRPQAYIDHYSTATGFWMADNTNGNVYTTWTGDYSLYAMTKTHIRSRVTIGHYHPYDEINPTTVYVDPTGMSFNAAGNIIYIVKLTKQYSSTKGAYLTSSGINFACNSGTYEQWSTSGEKIIVGKTAEELLTKYTTGDLDKQTNINIVTLPTKTTYKAGEAIDISGISVEKVYYNGSTTPIATSDLTYTPTVAPSTAGTSNVTVKNGGFSAKYSITSVVKRSITGTLSNYKQSVYLGNEGQPIYINSNYHYMLMTSNLSYDYTTGIYQDNTTTRNTATFSNTGYTLTQNGVTYYIVKLSMDGTNNVNNLGEISYQSLSVEFAAENGYAICETSPELLIEKYGD